MDGPEIAEPRELAPGIWHWARRHPEWHPGEFGAEVGCFLIAAGEHTLLIDPLLQGDDDPVWELIDRELSDRLAILITIPYHVRSSAQVHERFRERVPVTIHGHPKCASRFEDASIFTPAGPGDELPAGASFHRIGNPVRFEQPLHLPSHDALVFGDAIAETGGELRIWAGQPVDAKHARFYRERFIPTAEPLLELGAERILVTHGEPVMSDGTAALRRALQAEPWYHGD